MPRPLTHHPVVAQNSDGHGKEAGCVFIAEDETSHGLVRRWEVGVWVVALITHSLELFRRGVCLPSPTSSQLPKITLYPYPYSPSPNTTVGWQVHGMAMPRHNYASQRNYATLTHRKQITALFTVVVLTSLLLRTSRYGG